ncbi:chitin disaccharide deacetylase [Neobacillus cucumis]|uniref:chitin disaccharide deacetylase n=1 Tax=Neobacillus cucumis TaxID=1740721 RepID=UPI0028537144|nr:chitin disaccharide deacetylase [Neobacillus cucumis]MDR4946462.1 chitin disaccharide deacetylase [Neobacillus cucumis]
MIKLIINSDDFGYSRAINFGIIDAHKHGILNSATLMTNMPGAEHAFELAKENPKLQVGIHLVLTCGRPLLSDVPSLVDNEGNFRKLNDLRENRDFNLEEVEREWTAQIEKFLSNGVKLTHFDSHHHVHTIPELLPVVQRLSQKYDLPVRRAAEHAVEGVPAFSDVFLFDFYGETATLDYFNQISNRVPDGSVVEIMTHPGYLDTEILKGSTYNTDRVKETQILTTVELPVNLVLL